MLNRATGTLTTGHAFALWVIEDPVPGRPITQAVLAVADTVVLLPTAPAAPSRRHLRDLADALREAEKFADEQQALANDRQDTGYDRMVDAAHRWEDR